MSGPTPDRLHQIRIVQAPQVVLHTFKFEQLRSRVSHTSSRCGLEGMLRGYFMYLDILLFQAQRRLLH